MQPYMSRKRQYNYFQVKAVMELCLLLGIDHPSPEQLDHAYRFVENSERYMRSKIGH